MIGWEKTQDPEANCHDCGRMEDIPGQYGYCRNCGCAVCDDCSETHAANHQQPETKSGNQ